MPATACEPVPLELATHLGGVDALEFGSRGAPLVVALQGKSANPDVIAEWVPAARLLAGAGWRVVVPNLHSNELTKPGAVASKDVTQVVRDIILSEHNCGASCAVVMGKSWGGGEAHAARATQRTHAHSLTHACTTRTHTTNFTHARAARARRGARERVRTHSICQRGPSGGRVCGGAPGDGRWPRAGCAVALGRVAAAAGAGDADLPLLGPR